MADEILIIAEPREPAGSVVSRRLRTQGTLPGVVYGSGKPAQSVQMDQHVFEQTLKHHHSEHLMLDLQIGDAKAKKVLLKEVQHHPVTGRILHVDFHEISMTDKLHVTVSIDLVGEPYGCSQQGGVLEHLLRELEIECLPVDIPESIQLDVSALTIGDRLVASDVPLDAAKMILVTLPEMAIASVSPPRVQEKTAAEEEAEAAAAAALLGAEPEVIGGKKEEEADGAA